METADKDKRIETLAAENEVLKAEVERLQQQVDMLRKAVFGSRSEKNVVASSTPDTEQLSLFNEAEVEAKPEEAETVAVPAHQRKKKRSRAEITGELPVEEVVHKVEDRICDICGSEMKVVGREYVREELVRKPETYYVLKHYVEVVKCVSCGTDESRDAAQPDIEPAHFRKAAAPAPLIPHSFCSASLLAHILYEKYCLAVPLYRQEENYKNHGVELSRTTMANWIIRMSEKARAVFEPMKKELLAGKVIHADETVVQVLHEEGRKAKTKSRMWVYCNAKAAGRYLVLYDYRPTRGGYNAVDFLGDYSGYVICDGFDGYNRLTAAKRCGCWTHTRRKFVEALPKEPELYDTSAAAEAVKRIDRLFALEREYDGEDELGKPIREALSPEERHRRRQESSKPLLDEFFTWLSKLNPAGGTPLARAVQYALNEKRYLYGFLADPEIEISNNRVENAIRPFALGRKNWLFSDSTKGASASAMFYSLCVTAKRNGLNVEEYLTRLLQSDEPVFPY